MPSAHASDGERQNCASLGARSTVGLEVVLARSHSLEMRDRLCMLLMRHSPENLVDNLQYLAYDPL